MHFYILAYAGFFRIQEILHIKYGDIHFNSGYVVINVDISKTDQLRKGNEVVISVGSGEKTCPVKILRRYLTEVERYPVQSDHFVFRALSKCKSGHKLVAIISQLVIPQSGNILKLISRTLFQIFHCLVLIR